MSPIHAAVMPKRRAGIKPQLALMRLGRQKRPNEYADDYPRIVVVLDAKTRVIECADGIQWIVQRRSESKYPWAGRSFCRTKEALLRCVGYWADGSPAALKSLPDRFEECP
jgi:hypothetical protein